MAKVLAKKGIATTDLERVGIRGLAAMDSALVGPAGTTGVVDPAYATSWLPGFIRQSFARTTIDEIFGVTTIGNWSDEYVALAQEVGAAKSQPYADKSNIPLAGVSFGSAKRRILRQEQGFDVGPLEETASGPGQGNPRDRKRIIAQEELESFRNHVGFFGGGPETFGLLNDPNLHPVGSAQAPWSGATFANIEHDIETMLDEIETNSKRAVRPDSKLCLVLPTGYRGIMSLRSAGGVSIREYLRDEYPDYRIVVAEELKDITIPGLFAGDDAVYLIDETDSPTELGSDVVQEVGVQAVPDRARLIFAGPLGKGYAEDYVTATAGVFIQKPWAISRIKIN